LNHVADQALSYAVTPTAERADDAERSGPLEAKRVPDGYHCLTDLKLIGVAERHGSDLLQLFWWGLQFDDRQIGGRVRHQQLSDVAVAIGQSDVEAGRVSHDVLIRDDVPLFVDDEPGSSALLPRRAPKLVQGAACERDV